MTEHTEHQGKEAAVSELVCPNCGHTFAAEAGQSVPVRVTESVNTDHTTVAVDKWPLATAGQVLTAWRETHHPREASRHEPAALAGLHERIRVAASTMVGVTLPTAASVVEAINGERSSNDTRDLLQIALEEAAKAAGSSAYDYCWCWVCDFTDTMVVYRSGGQTWQRTYALAPSGTIGSITFLDDPQLVIAQTWYVPAAGGDPTMPAEATTDEPTFETTTPAGPATAERIRIPGRVLEAKEDDATGGRVYRVRIIQAGESKNGRIYPAGVLAAAAPLYENAKAFDHHRTAEEMSSGTIRGMVGYYSDVTSTGDGLEADLHLLPSATHAAEALDAALAGDSDAREPLVGLSHDVQALFRRVDVGGARRMEATSIVQVNSADVVAHPAAGGKATRAVAGGLEEGDTEDPDDESEPNDPTDPAGGPPDTTTDPEEPDVTVSTEGVLAALQGLTAEQLAAVGLTRPATETTTPAVPATPAPVNARETMAKTSFMGKMLVRTKVSEAGLPEAVAESMLESLPDQVTEADVDAQVASLKAALALAERAQLVPAAGSVTVTQESREKKIKALDAFFTPGDTSGYNSFREAFVDFTGRRPRSFDEDFNKTILRESMGGGYDSGSTDGDRLLESVASTTWAAALGDSVTRRLVAAYAQPSLQTWRAIVSSIYPVNDFRTQRIERIGGYGVLPAVGQGQPYQPLTSPTNEEATYAATKRGGTEDLTIEAIANDDVRVISMIPDKLALAAAQTLFRFVWDIFPTNAATSYDSTALFHASHANTDNPAVLSDTTLATGRRKMRQQAAYGDSSNVLSVIPKFLVVPSALENLAFQLTSSAVAVPASGNASNIPNLHQNLEPIVVDYYSDNDDWFLVADPQQCPTIEIGFYQGQQNPQLFTQADPNVGSMFDADKMTLKIRHVYGGAPVEHRGFYRGAN